MPPSESATAGRGTCEAPATTSGRPRLHDVHRLRVIMTSIGASSDGDHDLRRRRADVQADDRAVVLAGLPERVPVVAVEARAARASGFSENVTAWQPFAATRRTSAAMSSRVPDRRDRERDEPARVGAAPLVDVPVVVGLQELAGRCPCRSSVANSCPQKPGTTGSTASRARRWRSCRGRARGCRSSRGGSRRSESASMPYSSGGRPATALSPMLGISLPSNTHTSLPSSAASTFGARSASLAGRCPSNRSGGSTTWSSTLTRIRSSTCISSAPTI